MSTSKQLRVALAQTCPQNAAEGVYPGADIDPLAVVRANLADCADFVRKAKEGGAEVVCFAEYYLQGILNEGRQVRHDSLVYKYWLMDSTNHSHLDTWRNVSPTSPVNTLSPLPVRSYMVQAPLFPLFPTSTLSWRTRRRQRANGQNTFNKSKMRWGTLPI
jgi:hypothetical protein